ncbi:MAG: flagellar basal body P-ring formation chaperone FlgA [Actinomycetota bacterium]
MTRPVVRLAIAAAAVLWASAAPAAGLPAQLKTATIVEGDVIRLGDLWDNLGERASVPVASAPQPGKRVTLDARWLGAVAAAYGVEWRPAGVFERTTVERNGQTVDIALIETELHEALVAEGAPARSQIDIAGRNSLQMVVPANVPMTVAVRDLVWDPRMSRFTGTVEVPAGSPAATRVKVTGRVWTTTRIPVLTHAMGRGDVITEKDVEWQEMREENARRDVVTDARHLIGMEPRYQLRAGTPVRTTEVAKPVAVARNGVVTMMYRTKFMTLSAQGRAIEDGSTGDVIRVTNMQTKQTVEARVEAPGMVSVALGGTRPLAN